MDKQVSTIIDFHKEQIIVQEAMNFHGQGEVLPQIKNCNGTKYFHLNEFHTPKEKRKPYEAPVPSPVLLFPKQVVVQDTTIRRILIQVMMRTNHKAFVNKDIGTETAPLFNEVLSLLDFFPWVRVTEDEDKANVFLKFSDAINVATNVISTLEQVAGSMQVLEKATANRSVSLNRYIYHIVALHIGKGVPDEPRASEEETLNMVRMLQTIKIPFHYTISSAFIDDIIIKLLLRFNPLKEGDTAQSKQELITLCIKMSVIIHEALGKVPGIMVNLNQPAPGCNIKLVLLSLQSIMAIKCGSSASVTDPSVMATLLRLIIEQIQRNCQSIYCIGGLPGRPDQSIDDELMEQELFSDPLPQALAIKLCTQFGTRVKRMRIFKKAFHQRQTEVRHNLMMSLQLFVEYDNTVASANKLRNTIAMDGHVDTYLSLYPESDVVQATKPEMPATTSHSEHAAIPAASTSAAQLNGEQHHMTPPRAVDYPTENILSQNEAENTSKILKMTMEIGEDFAEATRFSQDPVHSNEMKLTQSEEPHTEEKRVEENKKTVEIGEDFDEVTPLSLDPVLSNEVKLTQSEELYTEQERVEDKNNTVKIGEDIAEATSPSLDPILSNGDIKLTQSDEPHTDEESVKESKSTVEIGEDFAEVTHLSLDPVLSNKMMLTQSEEPHSEEGSVEGNKKVVIGEDFAEATPLSLDAIRSNGDIKLTQSEEPHTEESVEESKSIVERGEDFAEVTPLSLDPVLSNEVELTQSEDLHTEEESVRENKKTVEIGEVFAVATPLSLDPVLANGDIKLPQSKEPHTEGETVEEKIPLSDESSEQELESQVSDRDLAPVGFDEKKADYIDKQAPEETKETVKSSQDIPQEGPSKDTRVPNGPDMNVDSYSAVKESDKATEDTDNEGRALLEPALANKTILTPEDVKKESQMEAKSHVETDDSPTVTNTPIETAQGNVGGFLKEQHEGTTPRSTMAVEAETSLHKTPTCSKEKEAVHNDIATNMDAVITTPSAFPEIHAETEESGQTDKKKKKGKKNPVRRFFIDVWKILTCSCCIKQDDD